MKLLILNGREVQELLPMPKCIDLMADALFSLARRQVILPLRPVIRIPDSPNAFAVMPAYSASLKAIGAKLISVFPGNHGTALNSHQGVVLLFDGENGSPLAMMDAASITAIRTAAVSGVATRLFARKDASTLSILGSGVQARTHLDAMFAVHPFKKVFIWSRNADNARALVSKSGWAQRADFQVAPDAKTAVERADVLCTVTASREPVVRGKWLRPGTHINAVGASLPSARELDTEAIKRAHVYVDRRESALNEAGDLLIPIKEGAIPADQIFGEIGELLSSHDPGRQNGDEITVFKSLGLAIEDLAAAHYLYERAKSEHAGTWVEFGSEQAT